MTKKTTIKDEMMKLDDQIYLRKHEGNGEFMLKMLKHQSDIITIDFGDECEEFEECCVICEAWRAVNVLKRLYRVDNE